MAFSRISVVDAEKLIQKNNATVIDIRDPASFKSGHIKNAIRVDNGNIQIFVNEADKSKPLIVVCYHGNSSISAGSFFDSQGFERVYSMDGGMTSWMLTKPVVQD